MRVGPYELLEEIGRGGMGHVHRARHLPTGALRALKLLDGAVNPETLARFQREAQALARAGDEGVVAIHDSGVEGRTPWFAMDLMHGSLGSLLKQRERLPWSEAVALVRDVARTVGRCHAHGLIHRDLKPDNVLLDEQGAPRVADFGCVRILDASRLTETGTVLGTPAYMSPEQLDGRASDARGDVYALGAILYQLVTGARPFTEESLRERLLAGMRAGFRKPSSLAPIPRGVEDLIARALAPDPARRPADGAALAAELDELLGGAPAKKTPSSGRGVLRAAALALVAVGALVAVALVVAVALGRRTPEERPSRPPVASTSSPDTSHEGTKPPRADAATLSSVTALGALLSQRVRTIAESHISDDSLPPGTAQEIAALAARLATVEPDVREAALAPLVEQLAAAVLLAHFESKLHRFADARRFLETALRPVKRLPLRLEASILALDDRSPSDCSSEIHDIDKARRRLGIALAKRGDPLAAPILSRAAVHTFMKHQRTGAACPVERSADILLALDAALELMARPRAAGDADETRWWRSTQAFVTITAAYVESYDVNRDRARAYDRALLAVRLDRDLTFLEPAHQSALLALYFGAFVEHAGARVIDPAVMTRTFNREETLVERLCAQTCAYHRDGAADEARMQLLAAKAANDLRPGEEKRRGERLIALAEGQLR